MGTRSLAIFDFDGTLIRGDSILRYVLFARKKRLMRSTELLRTLFFALGNMLHLVTNEKAKAVALEFWARMPETERARLDEEFARALVQTVYPQGKEALLECKKAGKTVLLLSASTENYMRFVARLLPVDALLCTRVDANGVVYGNCKGAEKLRRVNQWLKEQGASCNFQSSCAYGDSGSDYDVLTACGQGICVNPKRALRKKAAGKLKMVVWGH